MSQYGEWRGVPREQIPWHPEIDASKCTGCRTCFEFCTHGVYSWDPEKKRAAVKEPFHCVIGCNACQEKCQAGAISFPTLSILKPFLKNDL